MNQEPARSTHSITEQLEGLRQGDADAAQAIWQRYVKDLVRFAHSKLRTTSRRVMDEEDVVQQAFENFFRQVQQDRFPKLEDREDLWQILVMLVDRRSKDQMTRLNAKKAGAGRVHGDSMNPHPSQGPLIENVAMIATQANATELHESLERQLDRLPSDDHRRVAMCKLELMSNNEIRDKLSLSLRTVERHLKTIREVWQAGLENE